MAISIVAQANLDHAKRKYLAAKEAYYNGQPTMSDAEFDKLEDSLRKADPKWKELKKTGVPVANKKTETLLWRFMPSLSKMYDKEVPKFYKSFKQPIRSWIWMDKLDGTSLQLVYAKGVPHQLITRGDGVKGGDISFFIPHLVKLGVIPASIPDKGEPIVFRLEGLMKKSVFEKKWSREAKGDEGFDNSRNMVNGLFNRRDMHKALKDVDLVVLGVFDYGLEEGLKLAKKWKFKSVYYEVTSEKTGHSDWLKQRKEKSDYEIDGMVVANLGFRMVFTDAEKPGGIRAFKFNDEENAAQVKVKRIIYQTSGFGRIVPKVEIEATKIDGVVIKHCTVHNAKWMLDRKIGPGAIVKLVRSGGVIPKIVGVVKAGKIQLPEVSYELVGVNFIALGDSKEQDIRIIDRFLTTLGIEFIARKTIDTLYDVGLVTPVNYIKLAHASDKVALRTLAQAEIGPNMSVKLLTELKRVLCNEISLKQLMVASSCFEVGVGERRLSAIEAAGISMDALVLGKVTADELGAIPGFANKTVELILSGVEEFYEWFTTVAKYLTINGKLPKPKKTKKLVGNKLEGVAVTFTGYRDQAQLAMIESLGGSVVDFSSKTTVLLYKAGGKASSKVEKAGNKAMTWEQFTTKYGVK
jgi:DNA ligase (NAD+)